MAAADDVESFLDAPAEVAIAQVASARLGRGCDGKDALDSDVVSHLRQACARGEGEACADLGALRACELGGARGDGVTLATLERACALGSPAGCWSFAGALVAGDLGTRDVARGLRVYHRACAGGYARACGSLGALLIAVRSPGAARRATAYLDEACAGGDLDGCVDLAKTGAPKAAEQLRRGCDDGNGRACRMLAELGAARAGSPLAASAPAAP